MRRRGSRARLIRRLFEFHVHEMNFNLNLALLRLDEQALDRAIRHEARANKYLQILEDQSCRNTSR